MNSHPEDRGSATGGQELARSAYPYAKPYAYSYASPAAEAQKAFTLAGVWQSVRRWWKYALPTGLGLAAVSALIIWGTFRPKYRAEAWFQIAATAHLVFPDAAREDGSRFAQTQVEVIRSPIVLEPALSDPRVAAMPEVQAQPAPLEWLAKEVKVNAVGGSDLYRIQIEAYDPQQAALLANAVADSYYKYHRDSDLERKRAVIKHLEEEYQRRKSEIQILRQKYKSLAMDITGVDPLVGNLRTEREQQRNPLGDLRSRLTALEVDCKVLEARIIAAQEAEKAAKLEISDLEVDAQVDQLLEVQGRKQLIAAINGKLTEIKTKSTLREKDPEYLRWSRQLQREEEELAKLKKDQAGQVKLALEKSERTVRRRELSQWRAELRFKETERELLEEKYQAQLGEIKKQGGDTVELELVRADLTREQEAFERIAQRMLGLKTEIPAIELRVIPRRAASPPQSPVEPLPFKLLALASAGCLVLPFALAVFWEKAVKRISDSNQLRQHASQAIVAEIATLPAKSTSSQALAGGVRRAMTLFEESVDSLRTCLALSEESRDARVFAVTSAVSGEGKTSLASQLAASLARAYGKPTLLIDGDMRSPSVHRVFQIGNAPGLADVLDGRCAPHEAIVRIQKSALYVLPAGQLSTTPHILVSGEKLPTFLAKLREGFQYIVIDTPPVLYASESLVLANLADGAVFCTMHGVSRECDMQVATDRFSAAGVRHLATVINGTPGSRYTRLYLDEAAVSPARDA